MRHYLVAVDVTTIARALALVESILATENDEHRTICVCLDDRSHAALRHVPIPQLEVVIAPELSVRSTSDDHGLGVDFAVALRVMCAALDTDCAIEQLAWLASSCYCVGTPERLFAGETAVTIVAGVHDHEPEPRIVIARRSLGGRDALAALTEICAARVSRASLSPMALPSTLSLTSPPTSPLTLPRGVELVRDPTRLFGARDFGRRDVAPVLGTAMLGELPIACVDFSALAMITPELFVPLADPRLPIAHGALVAVVLPYVEVLSRAAGWARGALEAWDAYPGTEQAPVLTIEHTFLCVAALAPEVDTRALAHRKVVLDASWVAYLAAQSCDADGPAIYATAPTRAPVPAALPIADSRRMERSPRVSALVSTYAAESLLRGCIEDLLTQTLYLRGELEIIIVDSASPEAESAIAREYIERYPDIVLVRTPAREGVYMAWNRAARLARGAYLTNANTDDRHRPDALERLADELDIHEEIALVYADGFVTDATNLSFGHAPLIACTLAPEYTRDLAVHRCICGPQPMWRRRLHDELGWFDARNHVAGDYEFWMRISERYAMRKVAEVLGLRVWRAASVENANTAACARESRAACEYHAARGGLTLEPSRYGGRFIRAIEPVDHELQLLARQLEVHTRAALAAVETEHTRSKGDRRPSGDGDRARALCPPPSRFAEFLAGRGPLWRSRT